MPGILHRLAAVPCGMEDQVSSGEVPLGSISNNVGVDLSYLVEFSFYNFRLSASLSISQHLLASEVSVLAFPKDTATLDAT